MSHINNPSTQIDSNEQALLTSLEALASGTGQAIIKLSSTTLGLGSGGGVATVPANPNTSIQFNNAGVFGGSPNLEWDGIEILVKSNNKPGALAYTAIGGKYSHFGLGAPNNTVTSSSTVSALELWDSDNTNNGPQIGVGNSNSGHNAFTGFFLNNDLASDGLIDHYGFLGLNSSTYNNTSYGTGFATANQFFLQNTDGPITLGAGLGSGGSYINFLVGGSNTTDESMRILPGGNVGIGTTSPNAPLSVNGLTNGFGQIELSNTGKNSALAGLGIVGGTNEILTGDANNDFDIWNYNGGKMNFSANGVNVQMSLLNNGNLSLSTNQNGSSGITVSNTTAGTGSEAFLAFTSDSSAGSGTLGKSSSSAISYKIDNAGDMFIYNGPTAGNISILNDYASGNINFAAGGASTAQMTLLPSGNVGIGTTSPGALLEVSKSQNAVTQSKITNAISGASARASLLLSADTSSLDIYQTSSGYGAPYTAGTVFQASGGGDISFFGASEILRLKNNGNVGIGTTTPGSKLSVVGLPTSSAGLSTGDIWYDTTGGLNILKVV